MAKKKAITTKQLYKALKEDILKRGDRVIKEIEIDGQTYKIITE